MDKYGRVIYDKNFHTKNFILHYKNLIDVNKFKADRVSYGKRIDMLSKLLSNIDINKNILFIGGQDIHRELFLAMLSKFETLQSYYYCSMMQLHDIFWGNRGSENTHLMDEDKMYSLQDITERVLCLYINREMIPTRNASVVGTVITNRCMLPNKVNWLYFHGFTSDMLDRDGFKSIYDLFKSGDTFTIIDLNKDIPTIFNEDVKVSKKRKSTTNKVVKEEIVETSNNVSDLY
jgi:hypothetical protein